MPHFPVIRSILSASGLAGYLRPLYGLGPGAVCRILKTGINDTYAVEDGGTKYIFRIYHIGWRTREEIGEEIRLLRLLHGSGVPVSYPVADVYGNDVQDFAAAEGARMGVMFSFAKGEKMLNFPPEVHERIGHIMARMHRLTENLELARVTYTPRVLLEEPFARLSGFLDTETDEMRFMAGARDHLLRELAGADVRQLRHGAVHMDIWFDNLNIDGDRVTLFDFDFCGNGWLCYDIAYYLLQIHSTEKDEAERDLRTARFMKGYESVTPLNPEEKRLLPVLGVAMYFFYLGVQCSRYDDWSNQFLNTVYLKRYIMLLVKKYYDHHGLGTETERPNP